MRGGPLESWSKVESSRGFFARGRGKRAFAYCFWESFLERRRWGKWVGVVGNEMGEDGMEVRAEVRVRLGLAFSSWGGGLG